MRLLLLQDQVFLPSLGGGNKGSRLLLEGLSRRGHHCAAIAAAFTGRAGPANEAELVTEMDDALTLPGLVNAWTMPIKARIDMLSTGIRTPVGIKIFGSDLAQISKLGEQLEAVLGKVPGTRSAYAERTVGGLYLDIVPRRSEIARYGLNVEDVLMLVMPVMLNA